MNASCFDYAAESSNVKVVGCDLHLSLNCLLCTLNAKPVRMLKCYNDKNEECIFIDVSFVVQKQLRDALCIRSCKWFHWTVLSERYFESVCSFLFSVFCFVLFILSCTWFKVKTIVIKYVLPQVGWLIAVGTAYWMGCFTIKKEKWPLTCCVLIFEHTFILTLWANLTDLCIIVRDLQLFWSLSAHREKEWNIKH